jgi:hypothetical protein
MKIVRIQNLIESKELKKATEIDSFTHDGEEYDLQRVKDLVRDQEPEEMAVDDLKWILVDTDVQKSRIKTADIDNPVIVARWQNKWVVLDGAHRLTKAVKEKLTTLPTKVISAKELKTCKLVD